MKTTSLLILINIAFSVLGNDGVYLTHGGLIYPINENSISLDKEVLSFKVVDKICQVNIQFVFNNQENIEKRLFIGFQAPTAVGDVPEPICNLNQIEDFQVIKDGAIVPYKLKVSKCEDCELKELNELKFSQDEPGIFVYLFEIVFQPGENIISHSYTFPASSNVCFDQFYNYILKTGAKWKDGVIKDFILQIDIGWNKYFYVKDIFGVKSTWEIIGTGKVTKHIITRCVTDQSRMIRMLSGYLQITCNDFKPIENVEFGIIDDYSFITFPTDSQNLQTGEVKDIRNLYLDPEHNYSIDDLKLMKNTIYAQHGIVFKSQDLKEYFNQFDWYMPDPNLELENIILNDKEKEFIEKIIKMENK
jgi:hypothetical protein